MPSPRSARPAGATSRHLADEPASEPPTGRPGIAIIPGGGSAGLNWCRTSGLLAATMLPVPDRPDVVGMAAALADQVVALDEPRLLVGTALGAMVAWELAALVPVDGLVLIAAGFGITVEPSFLELASSDSPDVFEKLARVSLADRGDAELISICVRDWQTRGQATLVRHLSALSRYRPSPLRSPPPTTVVWGERDRAVPLADHVALALQSRGVLAPVVGAGHMPFLERPAETVSWIRRTAEWVESIGARAATDHRRAGRSSR